MKSGRASQSLSSVSSRSLSSDRSRHGTHSSRHSIDSDLSSRKSHRKMKFIIAVGIALPIIAAIIGVVAWAVSADSAFRGPAVKSLRRTDASMENPHDEDIFQILEDRHDPAYTRHDPFSQESPHRDLSRVDNIQNMRSNSFDDMSEKDPLYIVHFVPSPKPKAESSTMGPNFASTVSSDVLQKILSASKGTKPGTPQFVVFAPMPSAEDDKGNKEDLSGMSASGLNFLSKPPTPNVEIDYEYEEELRKYQELLDSKDDNLKDPSRNSASADKSKSQTKVNRESMHVIAQNFSSGSVYQSLQQPQQPNSPSSNSVLHTRDFNQQALQPQVHSQTLSQNIPAGFTEPEHNAYLQQNYPQPQQNYNQPQQNYNNQPQQNYNNQPQQIYNNQPQQIYPPHTEQVVPMYPVQQGPTGRQPEATDRSGHYEPIGIKLSLGNGGHGEHGGHKSLLGGGYSPLGIISSILAPVIRKPKVNLNGKLMFGVMLEKGVKFGDDKHHFG